jgi:Ulp1 family protease
MFGFIMNTEKHNVNVGHWVAVVVIGSSRLAEQPRPRGNPERGGDTIEYFDPLAQSPPPAFIKEIKKLVSKHFGKGKIYQLKINYVKSQNNNTNTCGFHACKFLKDRFEGQNWKQATKFKVIEDSIRGEADIKKFQNAVKQFDTMKF